MHHAFGLFDGVGIFLTGQGVEQNSHEVVIGIDIGINGADQKFEWARGVFLSLKVLTAATATAGFLSFKAIARKFSASGLSEYPKPRTAIGPDRRDPDSPIKLT